MTLREFWRRITTTEYTRLLKEELAHAHSELLLLRAENRALLNSILGVAGIPPIPIADLVGARHAVPGQPQANPQPRSAVPPVPGLHAETETSAAAPARLAAPMRRRSWQQINRMLEFESAKKKSPEVM
ncbi:MAG TPA: hypothetical protein VEG64_03125 [Candidatus Sulfotelmatobacter sp.]|nr:hypothetical protein [Candidatus Sulfotelmatobacter sp.]